MKRTIPIGTIAKYAWTVVKFVAQAGPIIYEGVKWVKKIIQEIKKKHGTG